MRRFDGRNPRNDETCGIPATRENYLELAYMGDPPEELSAEQELELPVQFQFEPPEEF